MSWLLLNDTHLGVQRVGGTTLASAEALQQEGLRRFEALLFQHKDKAVIINGDLFDGFDVRLSTLLATFHILNDWLEASGSTLVLGRGNHDAAKDSTKLSSFDFLGQLLVSYHGERVQVISEPTEIDTGLYMIPHMANQDLFDLALKDAEKREHGIILLHANYDNNFAAQTDHSLNVTRAQAHRLVARDLALIFGHEHVAKKDLGGQVWITGNQWPNSVADCLGNDKKFAHVFSRAPTEDWDIEQVQTWSADGDFCGIAWELINDAPASAEFIRVTGTATSEQGGEVVQAIAKFRSKSDAFVVSNAVKIEGITDMADLPSDFEAAKGFDVLGFLMENLSAEQASVVRGLLAGDEKMKEAA